MIRALNVVFAVANGACVAGNIADHGSPWLVAFNSVVMTLCAIAAILD